MRTEPNARSGAGGGGSVSNRGDRDELDEECDGDGRASAAKVPLTSPHRQSQQNLLGSHEKPLQQNTFRDGGPSKGPKMKHYVVFPFYFIFFILF